ncbi:hypothetical protein PENANT_c091G03798 [Penicillium antarcticum]|uniref:Uncharacterized protein n=1 Tax=Penicillium antarcticum TaxID=416450 RepID=A0A1V6PM36_9EURO|nr:hypothetical protein PENANT_c091G03798 [Penicillium antarcticum]
MRNGVNSIDKEDFLELIADGRKGAFKTSTIQNSFLATRLAPFDASRVWEKLNVCLDELPPLEILPKRPLSSGSDSDPNTLWTLSKFSKSQSQIKKGAIKHKFTSQRGIFRSREEGQDDVVVEDDGVSEDITYCVNEWNS